MEMKPTGSLMWEHRRIERMINVLIKEAERLAKVSEGTK
jgi:hypothetical protein